ncbi:MAG: hypothetical protein U5K37_08680 [Natrialbaceae archaeon]|nr:hypothetical protein [Natrialbaceae archaeon]
MPKADGNHDLREHLEEQLTTLAEETDTETLRELRAEAHRTVDKQLALLDGLTTTATQLLRVNLAIVRRSRGHSTHH